MNSANPVVGVILLNWNGKEDTQECIPSILASGYPHISIYVVDNNSKDPQEIKEIKRRFPTVIDLPQTENLGFCEGNNVGIRKALEDGVDYVMLLNNDTTIQPDTIEGLVRNFPVLKDVGAVSPVIIDVPEMRIGFTGAKWIPEQAKFELLAAGSDYEALRKKEPYLSEFANGCCLFTSAEILNKVGLLDPRYFAYFDEADWCKRLEKAGYCSYVVPEVFIYHKGSSSTPSLVGIYLMTRNRLLWMKEQLPFQIRKRSFSYLFKEIFWHIFNIMGLTKRNYTKQFSRALLQGVKDSWRGRFGRWNASTEKIIFKKPK